MKLHKEPYALPTPHRSDRLISNNGGNPKVTETHTAVPYAAAITQSLEVSAASGSDPTPLIYDRLFALHPDMEALFVMDKDGGVRGSMIQTCLECILDLIGERRTAPVVIKAARLDHTGYGISEDLFDTLFIAMRDVFRDQLGVKWTPEIDAAWTDMLGEIESFQ